MRLSTRIILPAIVLIVLTATAVGVAVYEQLAGALARRQAELATFQVRQLAAPLEGRVDESLASVHALRRAPGLVQFVEERTGGGASPPSPEARSFLERLFDAHMVVHPETLQCRLIGIADGGRELVRVERDEVGTETRAVSQADLQRKGEHDYFVSTAGLPAGSSYVSPIDLKREHGVIERPPRPVMRVATPVHDGAGNAFGILVLDLDAASALARIASGAPPGWEVYVANQGGHYLVHPDRAAAFAFETEAAAPRWQEDFPGLGAALSDAATATAYVQPGRERLFVAATRLRLGGGPEITGFQAIAERVLLEPLGTIRSACLYAGLAVALLAVALALLFTRRVTRPSERLAASMGSGDGSQPVTVPVAGKGEIADLARSSEGMSREVAEDTRRLEVEITERKRAQREAARLTEKESLLSALVQTANDAILTKTVDGTITSWNPAAEGLYGYTEEEAIGRNIALIVPDARGDEPKRILEAVSRGEAISSMATVRRGKDGRLLDVLLDIAPLTDASGAIVGASVIARDVTHTRHVEELSRLAIESSPNGVLIVNPTGRIELANAEAERMFGYGPGELQGESVEILVPDAYRARHPEHRAAYLQAPEVRMMGSGRELYGRHRGGRRFPVEVGLNPLESRGGLRVLVVVVDITERSRAQAELEETAEQLRRSNDELQQFAYVASHDLKEPLRMVASYTELLADRYAGRLDEKADKYIHYAVDGARRMQSLVDDLLAFSRVGTGARDPEAVDTGGLMKSVLRGLEAALSEASATVDVGEMPVVWADEGLLGQVFQNLIGNAIKFRREDTAPSIAVRAQEAQNSWEFSVADNGIGIDGQYADRIFQMFQRLHQRGEYPGSGIGLALVRKIVELHGGRVWFDSGAGEGTTFYFTLPFRPPPDEEPIGSG